MKKTVSVLSILLIASACQKNATGGNNQIKNADWLLGTWENKSEFGTLTESWQKVNDSIFKGQSYFLNLSNDTVHSETIVLKQTNDKLIYQTTIIGQNDNQAVAFPLSTTTENTLVFENTKHDYPQKITYTKKSEKSIIAEISGKQLGKESKEQFEMTKK